MSVTLFSPTRLLMPMLMVVPLSSHSSLWSCTCTSNTIAAVVNKEEWVAEFRSLTLDPNVLKVNNSNLVNLIKNQDIKNTLLPLPDEKRAKILKRYHLVRSTCEVARHYPMLTTRAFHSDVDSLFQCMC